MHRCFVGQVSMRPNQQNWRITTVWPEGLSGVQFQQGSTGHIYKCRIYHCGGGGVVVHGKGSRLFVRHCDVYRNHQTGLEARRGGQLIASENKVSLPEITDILSPREIASGISFDTRISRSSRKRCL